MRVLKLVFLINCLFFARSYGQNSAIKSFLVESISTEDGLPQNSILAINQINTGELLFGTGNGLVLFNGVNSFYPDSPLNKGSIRAIELVNDTLALVQTNNSVSLFNTQKRSFKELEKDYLFGFTQFDDSVSVIYTSSIYVYDKYFNLISTRTTPFKSSPQKGYHHGAFNFIIDLDFELSIFQDGKLIHQKRFPTKVESVLFLKNDLFLVALTDGQLFSYNSKTQIFEFITKLFSNYQIANLNNMILTNEQTLICSSSTYGLIEYSLTTKTETVLKIRLDKVYNQELRSFFKLFRDDSGMIWIGTDGAGAAKFNPQSRFFETSLTTAPSLHQEESFFITSMLYDQVDQTLWFGTHLEGLKSLKPSTNSTSTLKSIKSISLTDATIRALLKIEQLFFIGTNKGLILWNQKSNTVQTLFSGSTFFLIHSKSSNSVFALTGDGVYKVSLTPIDSTTLSANLVFKVTSRTAIDLSDTLLIGNETIKLYKYFNNQRIDFPNKINKVKSILEHKNKLWFATENGILITSKSFEIQRKINTTNGLLDDFVYGLVKSNDSTIWASTNGGLAKINSTTFDVFTFQKQDGLPTNEFNTNAFIKLPDSTIYFGSVNGFVRFKDQQISLDSTRAIISISGITASGSDKYIYNDTLRLEAGENDFSMRIQSIDYHAPFSNRIAYFMESVDTDWQYGQGVNQIRYSNLKPGYYRLQLKAWNSHASLLPTEKSIIIYVDGYFYENLWFFVLSWLTILLLISLSIYAYFWRKEEKRKAFISEQLRIEQERQRIAKDLHDDLGTGLTQIMMLNEMAKYSSGDDTHFILSQTSEISRNLVSNMNDLIWVLKPGEEQIDWVLSFIRERITRIFELSPFIKLELDFNTDDSSLKLPSSVRRHLLLILKELSNNTLKYAKASSVKIHIKVIKDHLIITYSDNGVGFDWQKSKGTGNGLLNISDRILDLNGSYVTSSDSTNSGFQITITLPIHQRIRLKGDVNLKES